MRSRLVLVSILLGIAGSLCAQVRTVQSPEGEGAALLETKEGYRIEAPDGTASSIEVPSGVDLSAFMDLPGGWIAAGHQWTETGSELVLLRQNGTLVEWLEPPSKATQAFRRAPALLTQGDRLLGLAWLEGDGGENNSVLASRWNDGSWSEIKVVAPWSGTAQLALGGAALEDGSSLLVWSAVDGEDGDIFWSRLQRNAWSAPARLHADNQVPDIVPTLVAVEGGPIVAWSQYDGTDVRLRISKFADGSWTDTGFTGEDGSVYPTAFPTASGAGFLYQTASPSAWTLIQISADGRLERRAAMPSLAGEARPIVLVEEPDTIRLRFPIDNTAPTPDAAEPTWHRLDWHRLDWNTRP